MRRQRRGEANEIVEKNWLPKLIKYVDKFPIKYTLLLPARAQLLFSLRFVVPS